MQVRACRTLLTIVLTLGFAATAAAETVQHDHDGLTPPGHVCMTVESPCPGPDCDPGDLYLDPYALGPRIVFINFDGVTLTSSQYTDNATTNTSAIVNSSTEVIPAFSRYDVGAGSSSRDQVINYIVDEAYGYANAFDIEFVTTRPSSGSYHMLVVGGSSGAVLGESDSVLGISILDCGDVMASNISFAFSGGGMLSLDELVVTIVHELAHALGLSHIDHTSGIMYPYVQGGIPSYRNENNAIPDGPGCGGATSQNSYQLLLSTIGPRGQDVAGPLISITSPTNGSFVAAGTQVTTSISDASGVASAEMQVDGSTAQTLNSAPWTFTLPANTPAGERQVKIRAYDTKSNSSFTAIIVNITSGDEDPCDGDEDCDGDWVCRGDICVPPGTPGALGDPCTNDGECASALCGDVGGVKLCTQACGDGSVSCPDGFECLGDTACWPSGDDGDGGGGGCMLSESSSSSNGSLPFLIFAAIGLAFVVTRRRG